MLGLIVAMLVTGAAGGVLAGLLGVGGGIVIVPALDAALGILGVDAGVRMHVAVATSLATIVLTSISSSLAHYRKGSIDLGVVFYWAPFILVGAVAGTIVAAHVGGIAGNTAECRADLLLERRQFPGVSPITDHTETGGDKLSCSGFTNTGGGAGHNGDARIFVRHN